MEEGGSHAAAHDESGTDEGEKYEHLSSSSSATRLLERRIDLGSIVPEPFTHPMEGDGSRDELRSRFEPVAPLPDQVPVVRLVVSETKTLLCGARKNLSASIIGHRDPLRLGSQKRRKARRGRGPEPPTE